MSHHLAQLNVARFRYAPDDARLGAFFAALDRVNAIADASPGFVWRLQDESGNATGIDVFGDPRLIVNLSVWESIAALKAFTYRGDHLAVFRRRKNWFEPMPEGHVALWWVEPGTLPDPIEAGERLEHLRTHGPGPRAFTFSSVVDPVSAG